MRKFSADMIERLLADYIVGETQAALCLKYQISATHTLRLVQRLPSELRRGKDIRKLLTLEQEKDIIDRYTTSQATSLQLAKEYKCCDYTIRATLRRHGIPRRVVGAFPRTEEQKARLAAASRKQWADNREEMLKRTAKISFANPYHALEVRLTQWARRALKAQIVERDKVCVCCGSAVRLHVHHIKPLREYQSLAMDTENCELLCNRCHAREECFRKRALERNIVRPFVSLRAKGLPAP